MTAYEYETLLKVYEDSQVSGYASNVGRNLPERRALLRLRLMGLLESSSIGHVGSKKWRLTETGLSIVTSWSLDRVYPKTVLHEIWLLNFLSYGGRSQSLKLGGLNVIIGTNGSGKSNFIDAISLLQSLPGDIQGPVRKGGGVDAFLNNGLPGRHEAAIRVKVHPSRLKRSLDYQFAFTSSGGRLMITEEALSGIPFDSSSATRVKLFRVSPFQVELFNRRRSRRSLDMGYDRSQSILAQRKDPDSYPELTSVATVLQAIRIYRNWHFGRESEIRKPGRVDLPNDHLLPDCSNLGLVLSAIQKSPAAKQNLLRNLHELYPEITDYSVQIEGGTVQVFLVEGDKIVPLVRLSDGTLRYICILAVLCHPNPSPLVCIEEPELGLHPDVIPHLGQLLLEASQRFQIIVTTHSDILIDSLSESPESVVVSERTDEGTVLKRLSAKELKPWLEKYRLGSLWLRGHIGGLRA